MAQKKRRQTVRININLPNIVIHMWNEAWKKENGYLPFTLTQRIEQALIEHTRLMEKRVADRTPTGGGGGKGGPTEGREEEQRKDGDHEAGPSKWHHQQAAGETVNHWQELLRAG